VDFRLFDCFDWFDLIRGFQNRLEVFDDNSGEVEQYWHIWQTSPNGGGTDWALLETSND